MSPQVRDANYPGGAAAALRPPRQGRCDRAAGAHCIGHTRTRHAGDTRERARVALGMGAPRRFGLPGQLAWSGKSLRLRATTARWRACLLGVIDRLRRLIERPTRRPPLRESGPRPACRTGQRPRSSSCDLSASPGKRGARRAGGGPPERWALRDPLASGEGCGGCSCWREPRSEGRRTRRVQARGISLHGQQRRHVADLGRYLVQQPRHHRPQRQRQARADRLFPRHGLLGIPQSAPEYPP